MQYSADEPVNLILNKQTTLKLNRFNKKPLSLLFISIYFFNRLLFTQKPVTQI